MATADTHVLTESELLLRLWTRQNLTLPLARALLKFQFTPEEEDRMRELLERNGEGELTPAEERELDAHVRVGTLVSILQSRARQALKKKAQAKKKVGMRRAGG